MEQPFRRRGKRGDEQVDVMRKLWTGEMVEHHGKYFDFPRVQMVPGARKPIPVFVGGRTPAALRRVARIGDGWIPDILSIDEIRAGIASVQAERRRLGRPETPLQVIGAPKDGITVDHFRRMEDAGVTHLWMIPWLVYGADPRSLEQKQDAIKRFADEIIAKLR